MGDLRDFSVPFSMILQASWFFFGTMPYEKERNHLRLQEVHYLKLVV